MRERIGEVSGEIPEATHQQDDQDDPAQSHSFDLKNLPDTDTAAKHCVPTGNERLQFYFKDKFC
jgi:hypothetical protein